jgi:hyaluronan synthase
VDVALREHWSMLWVRPTIIWISMGLLLLLMRTVLWLAYHPFAAVREEDAPSLTVLIPAYNEGAMVEETIASVAGARYPRERLQIIAIDDGSTDDTWHHIRHAALRFPGLVTPVRLSVNQGKRAALAEGFRRSSGEVIVTVDSDSVIERGALLAIAGPFRDPRVGAVAGKVAVHNRRASLIPRMLHVRFILSFDYLRSAQSVFRTVYCCPGALAAYRASVVRRVLPAWERQVFLGTQCTYGEDRALTNEIMRLGFDSVYQRTASVLTIVPTTYRKLCLMFLRWERSFVREEARFACIVWRRPARARAFALLDMVVTNLRYPALYASLTLFAIALFEDPLALPRMALAMAAISLLYSLYYLRSERSLDMVYGVFFAYFAAFGLFWIFPYAVLTARARGWLTR